MKRLMFRLSGEHPTLPFAEITGAMKAEHKAFTVIEELDQLLIAETKADPKLLASRLAFCHSISTHLCTTGATIDEILSAISSTDIIDMLPHGKTFAVEVERIKRSAPHISTLGLEKSIAQTLREEVDFKISLENPDIKILCVLSGEKCAVGVVNAEVDRKQFIRRHPTARPVFHPSTLPPALGRCMVNLARTPRKGSLLDPFCGVGGILIEAGLIGARPIGVDIQREMIEGAKANLMACGVKDFQLMVGDARSLPALEVDAVATDPPYGRQATTWGTELKELYRDSLPSIAGVLKRKGYLCITSPAELELEDMAKGASLRLIEKHEQRVHRSLTRAIYVFRRK
ncbi:MAG: methyltransferase domain-containing protein [Candidatus Hadarchaeales archaeon]